MIASDDTAAIGVDTEARAEIERRLAAIEAEEGVEILFAVESGSRAWGFASPDSDYDARFVYRHPPAWYLSVREARDVIDRPILDDYDVNGWDLRKALRLLMKSNPPLYEWLRSPVVYRDRDGFRAALAGLAEAHYARRALAHHYRNIAGGHWRRGFQGRDRVKRKKYLYILRALLAIGWLRRHESLPPMNFQELMAGQSLSADFVAAAESLIAEKAATPELGEAPPIPALDAWILAALEAAEGFCQSLPPRPPDLEAVDAFFRRWAGVSA
ncbi:MAG: nucleotidyltransferase domain-containing protein [Kiloniellales bacterium]|nr:nucleotidyltransferase domain-containing protein [Kiloniellales bacterium]